MPVVVAAEDDTDIADLLAEVLRGAGYTAHTAPDGEQALVLIREHRPDLVILDHFLPGMTGLQIAQQMRADPRTAAIPLLMLSSEAPDAARIVFDEVIAKPLRPRVLKAHVESLLAAAVAGAPDIGSPLLDRRRLAALAGYDWDHPELRREVDAITRRTAGRLGLPTGMANLVLDTTAITLGSHGVPEWLDEARGTPVEWSFCARTVPTGRPYVVPDATVDEDQRDNPFVTRDKFVSYAGVPLIDQDGQVLGAHCVLGADARAFGDADLAELRAAAGEIMAVLQRYRLS
jgi:DNA-binding response OmpR family regulator